MYQISVPPLARVLGQLQHILRTGAAHAREQEIDQAILLSSRLFPNMFDLTKQVQIATDMSKGCIARLTQQTAPVFEDNETRFEALCARTQATVDFIQYTGEEQFEGSQQRAIDFKTPRGLLKFTGLSYVQRFVLPNVHFHTTTAYNILRSNGVPLSKIDYLGDLPMA